MKDIKKMSIADLMHEITLAAASGDTKRQEAALKELERRKRIANKEK